jgi:hypothetical protein
MSSKMDWVRTLRTMGVAALLAIALLGAVLGSIGLTSPVWDWDCERSVKEAAPPPNATRPAQG